MTYIKTILVTLLVFMVAGMVQAGTPVAGPVDSFTVLSANCDQITVEMSHGDMSSSVASITVFDAVEGSPIGGSRDSVDATESPFFISNTFTFTPPITEGSGIWVVGEVSNSFEENIAVSEIYFPVSCDGDGSPVIESSSPVIQGCNDGRLNQTLCEPIAIYSVVSDDGVGIDIWQIDAETSDGSPELYISAQDLAAAQATGTTSRCTIATSSDGRTGVYLLPTGELDIVHGPDFENKYFIFTFDTYPSTPIPSTYIGGGLPDASDC